MIVKFKIVRAWPDVRGVDVHYYTDEFPEGQTIHVTLHPDPIPKGQELVDYLMRFAPVDWLALKSKSHDLTDIVRLLDVEHRCTR